MVSSRCAIRRLEFVAGVASVAAALIPGPLRAATSNARVVTIGTVPGDTAGPVIYGQELGFYKDAGLDAHISMMNSGPVVANAVTGGSFDVGAMNTGSLAVARSRGVPLKYLAPIAVATPSLMTDVVMVPKASSIRTGADFNNKTVAIVAVKTMQHAAFLAWIDKHGGDSKTVKFIEVPFPEMITALDGGRVDAAIPVEPFASAGHANNRVLGSVYEAMPPRFLLYGLVATDRWLQEHQDLATKVAGVIRRSTLWANAHHKESAAMLVRLMKVDPAIAGSMARAAFGTSLEPSMLVPVIDVMVKYGILQKAIDPNELIWRPSAT